MVQYTTDGAYKDFFATTYMDLPRCNEVFYDKNNTTKRSTLLYMYRPCIYETIV